jgi:hypothetical protein
MATQIDWKRWRDRFEHNQHRPLPDVHPPPGLAPERAAALAWSLARFQIGETGEGRIARRIWRVRLDGIDHHYRVALGLFIREEGRHARLLAAMVRALGGELVSRSWNASLFRWARHLLGVRTKLLVLLAAEVVGLGCYRLFAGSLPRCPMRAALEEIADDERAHLGFHRDFFATQASRGWRAGVFRVAWAVVGACSVAAVLLEHRRSLRALGVSVAHAARLFAALLAAAGRPRTVSAAPAALEAVS